MSPTEPTNLRPVVLDDRTCRDVLLPGWELRVPFGDHGRADYTRAQFIRKLHVPSVDRPRLDESARLRHA